MSSFCLSVLWSRRQIEPHAEVAGIAQRPFRVSALQGQSFRKGRLTVCPSAATCSPAATASGTTRRWSKPSAALDIMVAGLLDESIIMVEGEMKEISEEEMVQAIMFAHEAIKQQCIVQNELVQMLEPQRTVREYCHETNDPEFQEVIKKATYQKIYEIAKKREFQQKSSQGDVRCC